MRGRCSGSGYPTAWWGGGLQSPSWRGLWKILLLRDHAASPEPGTASSNQAAAGPAGTRLLSTAAK